MPSKVLENMTQSLQQKVAYCNLESRISVHESSRQRLPAKVRETVN